MESRYGTLSFDGIQMEPFPIESGREEPGATLLVPHRGLCEPFWALSAAGARQGHPA